jgi:adenosine/AMP kinase
METQKERAILGVVNGFRPNRIEKQKNAKEWIPFLHNIGYA